MIGLGIAIHAAWLLLPSPLSYYRSFYTPSDSMAPSLVANDRVLAHMRNYGPIVRGDVVIVRMGGVDYVKRVAALPGDKFAMRNGIVFLDGEPVLQQAFGEPTNGGCGATGAAWRLREQFPGEPAPHEICDHGVTPQDNVPEVSVGGGQYFLLGDNRDDTIDSRFATETGGLGIVPRDRISGRALFRYWRRGVGLAEGRL